MITKDNILGYFDEKNPIIYPHFGYGINGVIPYDSGVRIFSKFSEKIEIVSISIYRLSKLLQNNAVPKDFDNIFFNVVIWRKEK